MTLHLVIVSTLHVLIIHHGTALYDRDDTTMLYLIILHSTFPMSKLSKQYCKDRIIYVVKPVEFIEFKAYMTSGGFTQGLLFASV